jgi:hypothetical protein
MSDEGPRDFFENLMGRIAQVDNPPLRLDQSWQIDRSDDPEHH